MADDELTRSGTPPGPVEGVIVPFDRAKKKPVEADLLYELPTAPVELNNLQIGFLHGLMYDRLQNPNDVVARGIYLKLKAAAISLGVEWCYGDPPGLGDKG
jgi:hypothetical protein